MTIEIRIANNDDAEEWDSIISQSPHGTIFHQWNWLKITEKHTHTKLFPLIGLKGSTAVGVIPLFFQKKGPIRMVFSPPPKVALFYLGPIIIEYETMNQKKRENSYIEFQNIIDTFIKNSLKAHYTSISLPPNLPDPRPYSWSGYSVIPNYDYVIDLSAGQDHLLQSLDKRGRQNLSQARKKGIVVEIGGRNEYEAILDLMEIRYAQQGKAWTASRQYYLDIYDAFKDNIKIFVVKDNGRVITGSIDIQYRDTHYSWIGNPKLKNRISPSPNDLLIWESICFAFEKGYRYYVTMNAAGNKRLHSYYASKFDPALKVHFSVKRRSSLIGVFESIYTNITKPLKGKVKHRIVSD